MASERPISDETIVIICRVIGVISLPINVVCRMWNKSARRIVVVLILLQVLYILHNIHFTMLYIPFFYIKVAGGYCIGYLCEAHYVSFNANIIIIIILFVNIMSLFSLLLFYRHQSILLNSTRMKLSNSAIKAASLLIISLINIMPAWQAFIQELRDWIEKSRNCGVISLSDAIISALIIAILLAIYMIFAISCTTHICKIFNDYAKMRSTGAYATTIRGTKHTLMQMGTFFTFSAIPIVNILALAFIELEDDSIVQISNVVLFSLMSLTHSSLTIYHSPFLRRSHNDTKQPVSAFTTVNSYERSGTNQGTLQNRRKSSIIIHLPNN